MPETKRCRLGFIGCGKLMTRQHIPNAHRSGVCTIHTLCDIDADRLRAAAEKYPAEKTTTDYRELLADGAVDAVVIAMDHRQHCRFTREALEAGKHVYVEKPLGETVADALAIEALARNVKRRVAVGLNRRFAPAYRDLQPHLAARSGSCLLYYRIADPYTGSADRLHVEGCHIFDLFRWILGCDPLEVSATRAAYHHDVVVTLKFEDGSVAVLFVSCQANHVLPKEHVEAMWDDKAVTIEDFVESRYFGVEPMPPVKRYRGHPFDFCPTDYVERFASEGLEALLDERRRADEAHRLKEAGGNPPEGLLKRPYHYIVEKGWPFALDAFASAVMEGREPETATAYDAAWASLLARAANESASSGQLVRLDSSELQV